AVHRVGEVLAEVAVLADRCEQELLLAQAEAVVVGFAAGVVPFVRPDEPAVAVALLPVHAQGLGLRVAAVVGGAAALAAAPPRRPRGSPGSRPGRQRPSRSRPPRPSSAPTLPRTSRPSRRRSSPAAVRSCTCRAAVRR